jgi:MFS family permease
VAERVALKRSGDAQWVVDAYALGLATVLLASGSLGDLLGRRMILPTGLARP